MIRIRFKTKKDSVNGYYQLAMTDIVRALPDNSFEVSENGKAILDTEDIPYTIITTGSV